VDPFATFTIQLYWQVLGQARFIGNYDQAFRDQSRLFVLGTGTSPDVDPDDLISVRDPTTGLRYGALKIGNTSGGARTLVERANRVLARSSKCDGTNRTETADDNCINDSAVPKAVADRDLQSTLELIKVVADLGPTMDFGDPHAP
jgi:hypothetical protein